MTVKIYIYNSLQIIFLLKTNLKLTLNVFKYLSIAETYYDSFFVITSVISWVKNNGIVIIVILYEQAVFKIFRRPNITGCLELISPKTLNYYKYYGTLF